MLLVALAGDLVAFRGVRVRRAVSTQDAAVFAHAG
jgi:hypothetical protein